jgi:hypothetical protein
VLPRRRYLALLAAAIVAGGLALTQDRGAASATMLDVYTGTVEVAHAGADFADAVDGQVLGAGDRVRTGPDGEALITFFDGSTLALDPSSAVSLEELAAERSGSIAIVIAQTAGRTWSSVQKLAQADSRYEIRTPALAATVRGTAFEVDVEDEQTHTVQTAEGLVRVQAQGRAGDTPAPRRAGRRGPRPGRRAGPRVRRGPRGPDPAADPRLRRDAR